MSDLKTCFDNLPMMIHSINGKGELIFVNQFWQDEMGYAEEEVLGRRSKDFLSASSRKFADEIAFPLFHKQGFIKDIPYEFVKKDGSPLYVLLSGSKVVDEQGVFVKSVAISSNITSLLNLGRKDPPYLKNWIVKPTDFYLKLSELRKREELSQDRMAEILQISTRTYQRIEAGTSPVTVDHICILSSYFSISPSLFFLHHHLSEDNQLINSVLVVDDEEALREFMIDNLKEMDYEVYSANNGLEGLKILKERQIDIIISDIKMPEMDGIEFIAQVKELNINPYIFVCTSEDHDLIKRKTRIPSNRILYKPLCFETRRKELISI